MRYHKIIITFLAFFIICSCEESQRSIIKTSIPIVTWQKIASNYFTDEINYFIDYCETYSDNELIEYENWYQKEKNELDEITYFLGGTSWESLVPAIDFINGPGSTTASIEKKYTNNRKKYISNCNMISDILKDMSEQEVLSFEDIYPHELEFLDTLTYDSICKNLIGSPSSIPIVEEEYYQTIIKYFSSKAISKTEFPIISKIAYDRYSHFWTIYFKNLHYATHCIFIKPKDGEWDMEYFVDDIN